MEIRDCPLKTHQNEDLQYIVFYYEEELVDRVDQIENDEFYQKNENRCRIPFL